MNYENSMNGRRIIPMYMGSTFLIFPLHIFSKNHPHVYGEHYDHRQTLDRYTESSPCIWGALEPTCHTILEHRIIPMYMGSTKTFHQDSLSHRNHPHVYGEHHVSIRYCKTALESSPCIWGALYLKLEHYLHLRIIPMYMGSTYLNHLVVYRLQNHPHVYGEHYANKLALGANEESSPCIWGAH